jgi:hypothetical protein
MINLPLVEISVKKGAFTAEEVEKFYNVLPPEHLDS